jgi:hypothetical protein
MSAVSGGGNYISDGALMEWLAKQQDDLYADLRGSIDLSDTRAQLADELNTIKSELQTANQNHDFAKVDSLIQQFIGTYGADPQFAEFTTDLQSMAETIRGGCQARADYAAQEAERKHPLAPYYSSDGGQHVNSFKGANPRNFTVVEAPPGYLRDPGPQSYDDKTIDAWTNLIGGKLDLSSKNDQLTMIHIQEVKSTIDQGAQFASSFISSGDKTSSAIINNIA